MIEGIGRADRWDRSYDPTTTGSIFSLPSPEEQVIWEIPPMSVI